MARSLVAVHGTDPSSVYLGILARLAGRDIECVQRALYQDRTLLRLLGMRRTVFVATPDSAALIQAACARAVAARERRKLLGWLAELGVPGEVDSWLADVEQAALGALTARGEATAAELAGDDPRLRTQIVLARGKTYEGRQNLSSRVLFLLAAQGQVVRGRPRGSWTSHQHRWSPMELWCPGGLADWPTEAAEVELARRWLHAYGPATGRRPALVGGLGQDAAEPGADRAEAGRGGPGRGTRHRAARRPGAGAGGCAVGRTAPGLDPTPMGWQSREWFLGPHKTPLHDRTGNIRPTVWWDGRIVGGWAQARSGEIVWRFLEDAGSAAAAAVEAAAQRLAGLLGGVRLSARTRGRTWLEQELARLRSGLDIFPYRHMIG